MKTPRNEHVDTMKKDCPSQLPSDPEGEEMLSFNPFFSMGSFIDSHACISCRLKEIINIAITVLSPSSSTYTWDFSIYLLEGYEYVCEQ